MFYGFGQTVSGYGALGTVTPCTNAEWAADSDACEVRNLQAYTPTTTAQPAAMRTAADLAGAITANNGSLFVWTSNVAQSPELTIARANSSIFKVVAGAEPGEYTITRKVSSLAPATVIGLAPNTLASSSEPLGGYLPYILGGVGLVIVLSMLKK